MSKKTLETTEKRSTRFYKVAAVALGTALTFGYAVSFLPRKTSTTDNALAWAEEISPEKGEVWSAPATVKVMQNDINYAYKGKAELSYDMVKNEYESCQLMITAKEGLSYDLKTVDLVGEGDNVISAENIDVYNERYIFTRDDNFGYPDGYYPDALIPIEYARKANELQVEKDRNGGMWITVYVPKDTPAGKYTANFLLTVDGQEYALPVTVNVRDYTLTDGSSMQTVFSNRWERFGNGELDSSTAMNEAYYEFMLDYRIELQCLPIETLSGEEMVRYVDKYFDKISTYNLRNILTNINGEFQVHITELHEAILALAAASTPSRNLLSKAVFYIIDEPDFANISVMRRYVKYLKQLNGMLKDCVGVIERDKSGKYDSFKTMSDWQSVILDIPNVVPLTHTQYFDKFYQVEDYMGAMDVEHELVAQFFTLVNTVCPLFKYYDDSMREGFLKMAEHFDCDIWWYGCVAPTAPYATYHTADKNLLSARTTSWMQYKYDIEGTLYWDTSGYHDDGQRTNDVYEHPYIIESVTAGDGQLTYPGAKYGHKGAFPSMRLMAIRDGFEDYEMLVSAEKKINAIAEEYGEEINADAVLNLMYQRLSYSGAMYYAEHESGLNFAEVKETLFALIEGGDKVGFILEDVQTDTYTGDFTVSYYAKDSYEVYINDVKQSPVGGSLTHYTIELPSTVGGEATFKFVNKADANDVVVKTVYLGRARIMLNDFDYQSKEEVKGVTLSNKSTLEVNTDGAYSTVSGKNSLKFNMTSVITGKPGTDVQFKPEIKFGKEAFDYEFSYADVFTVSMLIYNAGDECEMTVKLYSGVHNQDFTTVTLKKGWNTVDVAFTGTTFSKLAEADTLALRFKNEGTTENPKTYSIYVDSMSVIMK